MFCAKCGKEVQEDWNTCPNCGSPIGKQVINDSGHPKKVHKPFFKKIWFWLLVVIVLILGGNVIKGGGSEKETLKVKADDGENTVVDLIEDVGGYGNWKSNGYKERVRTDITVKLPVTQREVNNYCVLIGALEQSPIVIMQENESPVQDWDWLMNAQPFEDGGDEAYFKVTLEYLGQSPDEEDLPVFIVSDIESY